MLPIRVTITFDDEEGPGSKWGATAEAPGIGKVITWGATQEEAVWRVRFEALTRMAEHAYRVGHNEKMRASWGRTVIDDLFEIGAVERD